MIDDDDDDDERGGATLGEEEEEVKSLFPAEKVWSLDDFDIGRVLGSGMFGKVYLAREKTTGFILALKMIYKAELNEYRMTEQLLREIRIQMKLKSLSISLTFTFTFTLIHHPIDKRLISDPFLLPSKPQEHPQDVQLFPG